MLQIIVIGLIIAGIIVCGKEYSPLFTVLPRFFLPHCIFLQLLRPAILARNGCRWLTMFITTVDLNTAPTNEVSFSLQHRNSIYQWESWWFYPCQRLCHVIHCPRLFNSADKISPPCSVGFNALTTSASAAGRTASGSISVDSSQACPSSNYNSFTGWFGMCQTSSGSWCVPPAPFGMWAGSKGACSPYTNFAWPSITLC
jgi:hypothetical protein